MTRITGIHAEEILDSRQKPTLRVSVSCADAHGTFGVPSGASTGSTEATELRDADGHVATVIRNIEEIIAPALVGLDAADQRTIDETMLALDGTVQKSKLGGNALIGVSIAAAKAAAAAKGVETFEHLRTLATIAPSRPVPFLYMNYINGGKHVPAGTHTTALQEHLIVPQADSVETSLSIAKAVGEKLRTIIEEVFGAEAAQTMGDEGGYILPDERMMLPFQLLARAVSESGNEGKVRFAIDAAASSFFHQGTYGIDQGCIDGRALAERYAELDARYGLLSIEDPFEEHDSAGYAALAARIGAKIVGDDLTTTDAGRIHAAAQARAIQAVIIKPNQVGTLSETLDAMHAAREQGVECIVSHRSGETDDDFIADLAFAFGTYGLKAGSLRKPERRAKYDRLMQITSRL